MSPGSKRKLSIALKAAILILAFSFIIRQLNSHEKLNDFNILIQRLPQSQVYIALTALFLLMQLNWFIEALKWKFLVKRIEYISTLKAIESVFCGLTWAVFTPNRIGEYGGRVLFLSPRKRIFGVIAMAVGSVGQMVVTNVLGSLALLWFIGRFIPLNIWLHYGIAFLVVIFCGFFLLFFFNIGLLNTLLSGVKFLKPYRRFFAVLTKYRKSDLLRVFFYSVARFAVFTSQYCLLIHLLVPTLFVFEITMMVFILFFIQSALPSLDLLDVGVRGMTATYFFAFITDQHIAIIAATTCIWLVNLIIPAIIGSAFVFKLNFFGTNRN